VVKYSHIILLGVFLLGAILISGCTAHAKNGDIVEVHYTGTLEDDTVFDTSEGREPLKFTLGAGQMISGFEQAVLGMKIGESKTVTIPADDAYGPHSDDLVQVVNREELSPDLDPYDGQQLQGPGPGSGISIGTVTNVTDTTITIDFNHHLAGKDLTFEIELMSIQ